MSLENEIRDAPESATEDNFELHFFGPEIIKNYEEGNYFDEHPDY